MSRLIKIWLLEESTVCKKTISKPQMKACLSRTADDVQFKHRTVLCGASKALGGVGRVSVGFWRRWTQLCVPGTSGVPRGQDEPPGVIPAVPKPQVFVPSAPLPSLPTRMFYLDFGSLNFSFRPIRYNPMYIIFQTAFM